jgi:two-component system phosphate regulon response regulator PhoB
MQANLEQEGYEVIVCPDGAAALFRVTTARPNLIVVDVELPKVSGLEVCRLIREDRAFARIPILVMAGKADEVDSLPGLRSGTDDFVAKPFTRMELSLRIRKLLRTQETVEPPAEELAFEGLHVDLPRHEVAVEGRPIHLTVIEFNLLTILAQRRGRVQTRERLLQDVWNYNHGTLETRTVDSHMRRLRNKLGPAERHLETIRGVGYRFREVRTGWNLRVSRAQAVAEAC